VKVLTKIKYTDPEYQVGERRFPFAPLIGLDTHSDDDSGGKVKTFEKFSDDLNRGETLEERNSAYYNDLYSNYYEPSVQTRDLKKEKQEINPHFRLSSVDSFSGYGERH
jgi:hypothetical protein